MNKIWTYKESDQVETEIPEVKAFKPTGKFYEDIENLCKLMTIKVHPALKPVVYSKPIQEE